MQIIPYLFFYLIYLSDLVTTVWFLGMNAPPPPPPRVSTGNALSQFIYCEGAASGDVAAISRALDAAEPSKRTGSLLPC